MNFPALTNHFVLKHNDAIPEFIRSLNLKKKVEEEFLQTFRLANQNPSDSRLEIQIILHVHLLRNFEPRPCYPSGLLQSLKKKIDRDFPHFKIPLGPPQREIQGLAPQWNITLSSYRKAKAYYTRKENQCMAHLLLVSTNPGSGKSLLDYPSTFLFQNGFPYWPTDGISEEEQGLPPVLILSTSRAILQEDFFPLLRKRHPYLSPECFQVLDPAIVKPQNRKKWIYETIQNIRQQGKGEGIFFLGLTPQCLTVELARHLKHDKTSLWPCLKNVRLLILDEIDALGTQSIRRKLGAHVGNEKEIRRKCRKHPRFLSLSLAYLIQLMKKQFSNHHLIVGLSATLSRSEAQHAVHNYMDLAGASPETDMEEWKTNCITSYIAPMIGEVHASIERCTMSRLTLQVHDELMQNLLTSVKTAEDAHASTFKLRNLKCQMINYCLSASMGPEVMLSQDLKLRKVLESLPQGMELIEKLTLENEQEENPMALLTAQLTIQHLKENPNHKVLVFYSRIPQPESFRRALISILPPELSMEDFKHDPSDVMIYCGTQPYPGARYTRHHARTRFQALSKDKSYIERILLISTKISRGENYGDATCSLFMGIPLDASDFVQSLGRILRAGHTDPKKVVLVLPQKEFLASEVICGLLLRNICDMSELLEGQMWGPLLKITKCLMNALGAKEIDFDDLQNHEQRKEFATQAYSTIQHQWKQKRREPKTRKKRKRSSEVEDDFIDISAEESDDVPDAPVRPVRQRKRIILSDEE